VLLFLKCTCEEAEENVNYEMSTLEHIFHSNSEMNSSLSVAHQAWYLTPSDVCTCSWYFTRTCENLRQSMIIPKWHLTCLTLVMNKVALRETSGPACSLKSSSFQVKSRILESVCLPPSTW
jgi:hypothetical protein